MLYRLPLELELIILQLAAPPLVKPRLAERVDFFIKISLVHRSFTAWAQDRLHDQFLYTYRPRKDEYARLKRHLAEAGFGQSRPIPRLYLDATRLCHPDDPEQDEPVIRSPSETRDTVETRLSADEGAEASEAQTQSTHRISKIGPSERALKLLFLSCGHSFDTLWLMHPSDDQVDLSGVPGTCRRPSSVLTCR